MILNGARKCTTLEGVLSCSVSPAGPAGPEPNIATPNPNVWVVSLFPSFSRVENQKLSDWAGKHTMAT